MESVKSFTVSDKTRTSVYSGNRISYGSSPFADIGKSVEKAQFPFQVVYDKENKCFRWNAIETNKEGKTDLVIYKYAL